MVQLCSLLREAPFVKLFDYIEVGWPALKYFWFVSLRQLNSCLYELLITVKVVLSNGWGYHLYVAVSERSFPCTDTYWQNVVKHELTCSVLP